MPPGHPRVTTRLLGQLGNQLFNYFAAASVAVDQNILVEVDVFFATRTDHEISIRHAELPLQGEVHRNWRYLSALLGASRREGVHQALSSGLEHAGIIEVYRPNDLGYVGDLAFLKGRDVTLEGYFQTYKYVEYVRSQLGLRRSEMVLARQPSAWLASILAKAIDEHPVGFHMRIGEDYRSAGMTLKWSHYVEQALELIDEEEFGPIWLFSDVPSDARNHFPAKYRDRLTPIVAPSGTRPIEVMLALASSSSLVIANSTFSWWSAYLAGHDRVIAPFPWFARRSGTEQLNFYRNLVPTEWRSIDLS